MEGIFAVIQLVLTMLFLLKGRLKENVVSCTVCHECLPADKKKHTTLPYFAGFSQPVNMEDKAIFFLFFFIYLFFILILMSPMKLLQAAAFFISSPTHMYCLQTEWHIPFVPKTSIVQNNTLKPIKEPTLAAEINTVRAEPDRSFWIKYLEV